MKIEPERFAETLQSCLGEQLYSVVLYGSSVGGDFVEKRSDYNLLVVVEDLGFRTLRKLREPFAKWVRAGQRAPLLFTPKRLEASTDVFPIELYDMRDRHKVLHGADVIASLELSPRNLRVQLESELKGKLIALREGYFACDAKDKALIELMVTSLANFQVLMRAALRLHESDIPSEKDAVVDRLATRITFDAHVFHQVARLKSGDLSPKAIEAEKLFADYLRGVEGLVDAIDAQKV